MSKLSEQEEKQLMGIIKEWIKSHGFAQKDLANALKIKSSRTSEIALKINEFYRKGGIFNVLKNLIKIEQSWLNNVETTSIESKDLQAYNQLDIDSLVNQIKKDSGE